MIFSSKDSNLALYSSAVSTVSFATLIILMLTKPSSDVLILLLLATLLLASILSGITSICATLIYLKHRAKLSLITLILVCAASFITVYLVTAIIFWGQAFNLCGIECSSDEQHHWIVQVSKWLTGWLP
jgi:hypothetical protein